MINYTPEQVAYIAKAAEGKTVKSLTREDEDGGYWVMTFTDESEFSFRFMTECFEED